MVVQLPPTCSSAFIGAMTPTEGATAIREMVLSNGMEATNTEAVTLAERLGNDPILIGLFGSLLPNAQISQLGSLAGNVIEQFITTAIAEVASRSGSLLRDEYRSALTSLTSHMLTNRNRYPSLTEIQAWLGSSSCEMSALRELIKHEKLCRLEKNKLDFRHDRIREALLVESMGQMLENYAQPLDIFFEPFYAEIIGQAIIRYPQRQEFLRELRDQLPLALVEAIRSFGTPNNYYHQTIIDGVKEWVDSSVVNGFTLDSVVAAVCWRFLEIDSPLCWK